MITIHRDVLDELLKRLEREKLSVLKPSFVTEIIEAVKYPETVSLDRGLKKLPPEIAKEIASYVEKGCFCESPEWSRRLTAHRYAERLFNKASELKKVEESYQCLNKVQRLFDDRSWITYLEDPNVRFSDKNKILKIAGGNQTVLDLIYKLLEKHEIDILPDIINEYSKLLKGSSVLRADVTTAIKVDEALQKKIGKYLERIFGTKVFARFNEDSKILGGIVIQVGDRVLDFSIRNKLTLLKKDMTRGV